MKQRFTLRLLLPFFAYAALNGCAVSPPVQEMSDARQAIEAATEARADAYAPEALDSAKSYLDRASRQLERGRYENAREAALFAKREAVRARDLAVHSGGEM